MTTQPPIARQLELLGLDAGRLERIAGDDPRLRDAAARLLGAPGLPCAGEAHVRCRRCGLGASIRFRCAGRCGATCAHGERAAASLMRAIPRVPVRHWVLTLPGVLRSASAIDQALVRTLARSFVAELFAHVRGRLDAGAQAHCGAVTLVHRAARALVFDVHVHALVLDGGYVGRGDASPVFVPLLDDPTPDDVTAVLARTRAAVLAAWRRRRDDEAFERLRPLLVEQHAAAGPVATTAVRRLAVDRVTPRPPTGHGARTGGVGVHVMPRIDRDARGALARLADYLVRAPVALGRLDRVGPDRVRHRLARPFADGSTHVEFSTDELARRLVALSAGGRVHRVSYHGALAPGALAKWRARPVQLALVDTGAVTRIAGGTGRRRGRLDDWPIAECTRCGGPLGVIAIDEASEPPAIERRAAQ